MGTLRKIGDRISQKTPSTGKITRTVVFKKEGKYYTSVNYNEELTSEEVKGLTVIEFK